MMSKPSYLTEKALMTSAKTSRWKNNERQTAEIFNEFLIPAERINRSGNYSESTYDVSLKEHPRFKLDSKYSVSGFKTSRMLDVVADKYCKEKEDIPILLTKGFRETGQKATVDARFLAMLLSHWLGYAQPAELEKIYYKEKKDA